KINARLAMSSAGTSQRAPSFEKSSRAIPAKLAMLNSWNMRLALVKWRRTSRKFSVNRSTKILEMPASSNKNCSLSHSRSGHINVSVKPAIEVKVKMNENAKNTKYK